MKLEPVIRMPTFWSSVLASTQVELGVHLWEGDLTVLEMNQIQEIGDRWYARYPGKSLALNIVYPGASLIPPPAELRDRFRRLLKHWESRHLAACTVMLAEGLLGAMHRSVLTGMLMIVPPPHPAKIFATVDDALPWLLGHARGGALDPRELRAAIDALRAEFSARTDRRSLQAAPSR